VASVGELIGVCWGDLNLTSRPAVVSVQRNSHKGVDRPTKSHAGMREVLLIDRVVRVLRRYQRQCFGATIPSNCCERPLFQTAGGTKLDPIMCVNAAFCCSLSKLTSCMSASMICVTASPPYWPVRFSDRSMWSICAPRRGVTPSFPAHTSAEVPPGRDDAVLPLLLVGVGQTTRAVHGLDHPPHPLL
jgi:hypothetical protein